MNRVAKVLRDSGSVVSKNYRNIKALRRTKDGSRYSRKLRENKMIPGIVYGQDENGILSTCESYIAAMGVYVWNSCTQCHVDVFVTTGLEDRILVATPWPELQREINTIGRAVQSTFYNLDLDGEIISVLPRNMDPHPSNFKKMRLCFFLCSPFYFCHQSSDFFLFWSLTVIQK